MMTNLMFRPMKVSEVRLRTEITHEVYDKKIDVG